MPHACIGPCFANVFLLRIPRPSTIPCTGSPTRFRMTAGRDDRRCGFEPGDSQHPRRRRPLESDSGNCTGTETGRTGGSIGFSTYGGICAGSSGIRLAGGETFRTALSDVPARTNRDGGKAPGNQSRPAPSRRSTKCVTGSFVRLPTGCCGSGFRWVCGISSHKGIWEGLGCTRASQMVGMSPRFPSAIGYGLPSKAAVTSPRRSGRSRRVCSRCCGRSALKSSAMHVTRAASPSPSVWALCGKGVYGTYGAVRMGRCLMRWSMR